MLNYPIDYEKRHFNTEIVSVCFEKLEIGKSAGIDEITVEHILNCHPVIFSLLANLCDAN